MTGEPGFLVTGSGRCGTGYLAAVLTECGLNVGHEGWWSLDKEPSPGLDGDVSWLGCFDAGYDGRVFAQVRDPLACIPSIHAREAIDPRYLLLRRCTVSLSGDWPVDAARIWLDYTRRALDRCHGWWRVEDVTGDTLARLLHVDAGRAQAAIDATPRDVNAGPGDAYMWPDDPIIDQALALGRALGYTVTDPRA